MTLKLFCVADEAPAQRAWAQLQLAHWLCVANQEPGCAADVVNLTKEAGKTYSQADIKAALEQHKPKLLFLTQVSLHVVISAGLSPPPGIAQRTGGSCAAA